MRPSLRLPPGPPPPQSPGSQVPRDTAQHPPRLLSLLILQVRGPSWIIFLVVRSRLC